MTSRSTRSFVALLALVALFASACSDDSSDDSATDGSSDESSGDEGADGSSEEGTEDDAANGTGDFSAIDSVVEEFIAENELNGAGVVVVKADEGIVYEDYWGDFSSDRPSLIASASKMLSAGVLLHLADEGLLEMDTPIVDQLDWEGDSKVTPAQLLSNSSGLVGLLPNPTYAPYLCQYMNEGSGSLSECGQSILLNAEDDADVIAPDTRFRYGGGQWQVAGAVAEAASGKSWEELVNEIYVEPCGVDSLVYNNHFVQLLSEDFFYYPSGFDGDPSVLAATDNPNVEAGAYVTPPDYAELLAMHLNGGKCGDTQVLSQEALDAMHSDRIADVYRGDAVVEGGSGGSSRGYGMGWWIDRGSGILEDPGAYGAVAQLDLESDYGIYVIVEASTDLGRGLTSRVNEPIAEAVGAA
ncbi:MAG: serine hydrolase domain-containing protein [Microthrixaceae bacterium]